MDLSIIIVNYHQSSELVQCLNSLEKAVGDYSAEVFVVNNSPEDKGLPQVLNRFSQVYLIGNPQNAGFSRANNQAAKMAQGDYFLFLNPDSVLEKDSISGLLDFIKKHTQIGILAPKVLNSDGTLQYSCRRYPSIWTGLFNRYSLLSNIFPNNPLTRKYLMKDFDHTSVKQVDWVSGCCMLMPKEIFQKVTGFDEKFFLFNEDVDICKRVTEAGFRVVYYPKTFIYHHISSSGQKMSPGLIIKRHLGMSYYQKKHMGNSIVTRLSLDFFISLRCASQLLLNVFK